MHHDFTHHHFGEGFYLELFRSPDASRSKNASKLKLFVVNFATGRLVEEFIFTPIFKYWYVLSGIVLNHHH